MNQAKPTHKSDFLLATLRVYVFSPLAKWVGIVSFLYCTQILGLIHRNSQEVQSKENKNSNNSTLSMSEELKLKILIILYIHPII